MSSRALFNEFEPYAAEWLRNLSAAGHIASGDVDDRSVEDLTPEQCAKYTQCHFFAGIGIWSRALKQAGWNDDRAVWTASLPCQGFSTAGKGRGFADERHLWPSFFWLVQQCRPVVIFGEQVGSKSGLAWFDVVSTDLEAEGYTVGATVFPACSVGAPHLRQRLYWVAYTQRRATERRGHQVGSTPQGMRGEAREQRLWDDARHGDAAHGVAYTDKKRRLGVNALLRQDLRGRPPADILEVAGSSKDDGLGYTSEGQRVRQREGASKRTQGQARGRGSARGLAYADQEGPQGRGERWDGAKQRLARAGGVGNKVVPSPTNGFWRDADWLRCRDGKWRPARPGSQPLASRSPTGMERLCAYGNGLVAPQAQAFIEAFLDVV